MMNQKGDAQATSREAAAGSLPPIFVRRSEQAERARITVSPHHGVVIVVPTGVALDITQLVQEKGDWIRMAWRDVGGCSERLSAPAERLLPSRVRFAATGEVWRVTYKKTASTRVRAVSKQDQLVVSGNVDDHRASILALHRWLQSRAVERLVPWAARRAEASGSQVRRISVRNQSGRWGGCSALAHITLNRKLLFLNASLVRAVIDHELAHLRQPNHSSAFWEYLEGLDPDAREHHAALRTAHVVVPDWAEWRLRPPALECWTTEPY